jgi:hypothetical protein
VKPFKQRRKYVVERSVDGAEATLFSEKGETWFEPEQGLDTRVASVVCDEDFVVRGVVHEGKQRFFVHDVLRFAGSDLRGESWPDRYRVLKNEFSWNTVVQINRPLVVSSREEMMEAFEMFELFSDCTGGAVRDYDASFEEQSRSVYRGG